jgi:hypothetical protein
MDGLHIHFMRMAPTEDLAQVIRRYLRRDRELIDLHRDIHVSLEELHSVESGYEARIVCHSSNRELWACDRDLDPFLAVRNAFDRLRASALQQTLATGS